MLVSAWFAGLPAAVRGWKLEAVKRAGGDPPVLEGAGYNEVYTALAGYCSVFSAVSARLSGDFQLDGLPYELVF